MTLPLVSVTIITYNQEKYIAQCIESVLNQITDFYYEIVIGDDGSTDGTKKIISNYAENNPRIKFIDRKENIGLQKNIVDVINNCSGKYIAFLEGDDYWINDKKLQMQADFLNKNSNCSACFTNCITFQDGFFDQGKILYGQNAKKEPPTVFSLDYYLSLYTVTIPNNTKMFRKSALPDEFPSIFYNTIQWDFFIHLFNGLKGDFGYIDEITLAYRRHNGAMISEKNTEKILLDAMYNVYNMNQILPPPYLKYYKHPLYEMNTLAFFYLKNRHYLKYFKWYMQWLKYVQFKNIKIRDEFYKFRKNLFSRNFV